MNMVGMAKVPPSASFAAAPRRSPRFSCRASGRDELQQPPALPASLRAIQAKRKLAAARRGVPRAAATGAVAALVAAVQGAAVGDAVAWVLSKVHLGSPDLAVGLLGLVASCLGTAVEEETERMRAKDDDLPELDMERELWARIGILHGEEETPLGAGEGERRKAAYERIIAAAEANSLILSNYAQLLYEYDKDLDRAEAYFKRAVAVEPADGEAMRRFAMFLWHARGDLGGAEDMLLGAIDEDPESSHHRSSYAWFLWMTGGVETCVIDTNANE